MPSPENIVTISHNNVFPFLLHSSLKHRIALRSYTLQKPCTYTDNTFQRRRKKSIFVVFIRLCNNALFLLKVIHLFCLYCTLAFCYSGNRHVSEWKYLFISITLTLCATCECLSNALHCFSFFLSFSIVLCRIKCLAAIPSLK